MLLIGCGGFDVFLYIFSKKPIGNFRYSGNFYLTLELRYAIVLLSHFWSGFTLPYGSGRD